jgi:predicted Zn-dependent protease
VLVAAGAVGGLVWKSVRPDAARDEAVRTANQGRFADAEPALRAAYARNPDDVEVVETLARGYDDAKSPEAEAFLTRWVELRPDDPNVRRARFEFYRRTKDTAKAFADGRRLLELDRPDSNLRREAYGQLRRTVIAEAYSLGDFEDAETLCRAAVQSDRHDRAARSMLAEIRRARGDLAEAGTILDQLLKEFPTHTPAMLARATVYLDAGEPEKAVPLLREILKTDRTRQRTAGAQLVVALERTGQHEEAEKVAAEVRRLQDVEVYGEAMKSQPDNPEIRVRLAERLLADGHTREGVAHLEAVLATDPKNRAAHLALAAHYEKQGQPARAAEHRRLAGPNP